MMNKGQDKINIEIKIAGERIMLLLPRSAENPQTGCGYGR